MWHALTPKLNNRVYDIEVVSGKVYCGGMFTNAGGDTLADKIAYWQGGSWHALGNLPLSSGVTALSSDGTNLYVTGGFSDAGGDPDADKIAIWDGSSWSAVGPGINSSVMSVAIDGSDVYAGGLFTDAGSNPDADHIAKYDMSSSGINENINSKPDIDIYPNPTGGYIIVWVKDKNIKGVINLYSNEGRLILKKDLGIYQRVALATGTYYIEVINQGLKVSKPIVIK